jgi:cell division transport system permease protein
VSANEVFAFLVPMALLIGAGIGFVGSTITIRKHLKV